ncbi:MAG: hypothetical protein ABFC80_02945 [Coriobacteriales bacterium]
MAPRCTICDHPKREQIDKAVTLRNAPMRVIAGRFSVSQKALQRHKAAHLHRELAKAVAKQESRADEIIRELYDSKQKVLDAMVEIQRLTGDQQLQVLPGLLKCVETHCRIADVLLKYEVEREKHQSPKPEEERDSIPGPVQRLIDAVVTNA